MLCLSHTCNNILMWAHYADEHRGFVVGLDEGHAFFQSTAYYYDPPWGKQELNAPGFGTLRDVSYKKERPNIDRGDNIPLDSFFTKSTDWSYEKEVRIYKHLSEAEETIGETYSGVSLFGLPRRIIRKVMVGALASSELQSGIQALLKHKNMTDVVLEAAELDRREYSLKISEIDA